MQSSTTFEISGNVDVSFLFTKDDKGRIILDKLGDGTYGSVYKGRTETGLKEDVAIKLLYDNNTIRPRQISELNSEELDTIIAPLAELHGKSPEKIKDAIVRHRNSGYRLWKELEKAYNGSDEARPGEGTPNQASKKLNFESFMDAITAQVSSSAVYRFRQEQFVSETLLTSSRLRFGAGDTKGIVKVRGGTDKFLSILEKSPDLKDYFDEIEPIKVSNYVLVMDLYSFSLKDLLERPLHEGDRKTGYDILKTLPHKQRIREALIILREVADGLEKLHNVQVTENNVISYFHRDIKPGNIMIRKTSTKAFEVALGDLGNLPYEPGAAPSSESQDSLSRPPDFEYAPGTQNYRSPEQKYYMDVADVQVEILPEGNLEDEIKRILNRDTHMGSDTSQGMALDRAGTDESTHNNADSNLSHLEPTSDDRQKISNSPSNGHPDGSTKYVVLIVRDPKFKNTLIEENDFVIFSKDTERQRHPIKQCIPLAEDRRKNESGDWGFVLNVDLKKADIKTDKKTQVEFYKTQRYRTDLFGIGAVMFDMITVGASPEQFYESIRKYEGQSIDTIVNRYDTLTRGELEGENPDFIEIFKPFRNSNNPLNPYPDREIIEFILKCMLYQSEGTFYQENAKTPRKASEALRSRMEELRVKYTQDYRGLSEGESMLIHRLDRSKFENERTGESIPFNQRIDELQGLIEQPDDDRSDPSLIVADRLMYGTYYFWRVVELVRNRIQTDSNSYKEPLKEDPEQIKEIESLHLLQILPNFISLQLPHREQNKADLSLTALATDILKDLRENRLELLIRSAANAFVPNELVSMRRDIRLLRSQNGETVELPIIRCKYCFRDAAIVSRDALEGDWLVVENQLWTIKNKPSRNELVIELNKNNGTEASPAVELFDDETRFIDAIYFSRIDLFKYYLEMLGLYLQHLILTYTPITTTSRNRVDIRALIHAFEIGPPYRILPLESRSDNELKNIHESIVHMFIRLALHEAEDSYYTNTMSKMGGASNGQGKPNATMFNQIQNDAEVLYRKVMEMLKISDYVLLDHPKSIESLENLPPNFKSMVDELKSNPIDIEKIIKRSGLIEGEDLSVSK